MGRGTSGDKDAERGVVKGALAGTLPRRAWPPPAPTPGPATCTIQPPADLPLLSVTACPSPAGYPQSPGPWQEPLNSPTPVHSALSLSASTQQPG